MSMSDETPAPGWRLSWTALYLTVGIALVLEIAAFSAFTWIYR